MTSCPVICYPQETLDPKHGHSHYPTSQIPYTANFYTEAKAKTQPIGVIWKGSRTGFLCSPSVLLLLALALSCIQIFFSFPVLSLNNSLIYTEGLENHLGNNCTPSSLGWYTLPYLTDRGLGRVTFLGKLVDVMGAEALNMPVCLARPLVFLQPTLSRVRPK